MRLAQWVVTSAAMVTAVIAIVVAFLSQTNVQHLQTTVSNQARLIDKQDARLDQQTLTDMAFLGALKEQKKLNNTMADMLLGQNVGSSRALAGLAP